MSWSTRAERCWSVGLTSWSRAACEVTGVTSSASAQAGFTAAWLSAASTARWSLEHRQQSNRQTGQYHAQNGYAPSFRMVRRRSLTLTGTNTTADTVRSASAKAMDGDLCGSMGGLAASSPKPLLRDSSVVSNRSFTAPTGTESIDGFVDALEQYWSGAGAKTSRSNTTWAFVCMARTRSHDWHNQGDDNTVQEVCTAPTISLSRQV